MKKGFEEFLGGTLSDITLAIPEYNGKYIEFQAHKIVLASKSRYFYMLFTQGFKERESKRIVLPDFFNAEAFEGLLRYFYGLDFEPKSIDKLPKILEMTDYLDMPPEMEVSLIFTSGKKAASLALPNVVHHYGIFKGILTTLEHRFYKEALKQACKEAVKCTEEILCNNIREVLELGPILQELPSEVLLTLLENSLQYVSDITTLGLILENIKRQIKAPSLFQLLSKIRDKYIQQFKDRLTDPSEGFVVEVAKEKLLPGRIAEARVFCVPSPWIMKVRVDDNSQLGLYLCSKTSEKEDTQRMHSDGPKKGKQFFGFTTGIYNFQIEDTPPVYEVCGIFGFPRNWNYLYGPSRLGDVETLKRQTESPTIRIRCWIYESNLHAAILHFLAANLEEQLQIATLDDITLFPIKDFYSLLESEELSVSSEDTLLNFMDRYIRCHSDENCQDVLKSIRLNRTSTMSLLNALKNIV